MTRSRFARRCVAALVTTAALAAPLAAPTLASALGTGEWGDPFRVSPQAFDDTGTCGGPSTAIHGGDVTYVWCQRVPISSLSERPVLQTRVYRADGTATDPLTITSPTAPGFVSGFRVASDGAGGVHVAFLRTYESCTPFCAYGYSVEHVRLDANGAPIGDPATLASAPVGEAQAGSLDLEVNDAGEALVAWSRYDYSDDVSEAHAVRIDAAGKAGSAIDLSESAETAWTVAVALADDGSAFAAWTTNDGADTTNGAVAGRAIQADGTLLPIQTLAPDDRYLQDIRVAIDPTGKGTAVIWQYPESGPGLDLLVRQVGSNGKAIGSEPTVVAPAADSPNSGDVEAADTGAIMVVWTQGEFDYELRSRVVGPTGTLGASRLVAPAADWDYPLLALTADGSGHLLASSYDEDTDLDGIQAFRLAADGTAVAGPTEIATERHEYNEIRATAVAADTRGDVAAGWSETIYALDHEDEAFGAIFDGTAPELDLWAPAKATVGSPIVAAVEGSDRNAVAYAWSFGDGGTGNGRVVQHAYAAPGTHEIAVTGTDSAGNASTSKATVQVVAESAGIGVGDGGGGVGGNAPDVTPPDTRIVGGPKGATRNRRPRFRFVASEPDTAFECKLDRRRWAPCKSPLRIKRKLRFGKHVLKVRAVDAAGNADRFPDSREFRVVKPKRKRAKRR